MEPHELWEDEADHVARFRALVNIFPPARVGAARIKILNPSPQFLYRLKMIVFTTNVNSIALPLAGGGKGGG